MRAEGEHNQVPRKTVIRFEVFPSDQLKVDAIRELLSQTLGLSLDFVNDSMVVAYALGASFDEIVRTRREALERHDAEQRQTCANCDKGRVQSHHTMSDHELRPSGDQTRNTGACTITSCDCLGFTARTIELCEHDDDHFARADAHPEQVRA